MREKDSDPVKNTANYSGIFMTTIDFQVVIC